MARSNAVAAERRLLAERRRKGGDVRADEALPVGGEHEGRGRVAGGRHQAPPLIAQLDVEPLHRDLVALEEVANGVRRRRPPGPDHAHDLGGRPVLRVPVLEQVVDDRVEPLLGRIPGLEDVVVEPQVVDRADGHVGVGVGGEQHRADVGEQLAGDLEHLGAGEVGHPLVGHDERDRLVAQLQLPQRLDRLLAACRGQDPVVPPVAGAEVAAHRSEDRWVVIDRHDHRALRSGCGAAVAGRRLDGRSVSHARAPACRCPVGARAGEPGTRSSPASSRP